MFYYLLCVQYHLGTSGLKGGGKERRSSRKTTPSKKLLLSKESSDTFAQHDAEAEAEMKSKRAQTRARKHRVSLCKARSDAVFSHEELEALAGAESPRPASLSSEAIDQLVRDAQELLHAPHEVCAVCDEIVLHKRDILLQSFEDLPNAFFTGLVPPDGTTPGCPVLDPLLLSQYNVSTFFPPQQASVFDNLLLSPCQAL